MVYQIDLNRFSKIFRYAILILAKFNLDKTTLLQIKIITKENAGWTLNLAFPDRNDNMLIKSVLLIVIMYSIMMWGTNS